MPTYRWAFYSLSAKRTDPACYIQDCFSDQLLRFKEEIPPILFECATEQHDPIELQPTFRSLDNYSFSCPKL